LPPSPQISSPKTSVLFVTPECAPLVKTGGLGDVSAALPAALQAIGVDVRVLLPGYPAVLAANRQAAEIARFTVLGQPVRLLEGTLDSGVPLYILENARLFDRGGGPYQADDGHDWDDNALRFGVLSRAGAMLGSSQSPIAWRPSVVHAHDWPAALAPVYLHFMPGPRAASLITIHNLAFQGVFDGNRLDPLELPPQSMGLEGLEFYGRYSFLKGGLVYSDAINTVSPTYAQEIQTEALGFGMQGVLRQRTERLYGVLNGIDTTLWNPQTDSLIATRYGSLTLEKKLNNKLAFKQRMGLAGPNDVPLFAMVSRLTHQKGIDLLIEAAARITALPAQLAIVGTGDRELVERLTALQARLSGRMALFIGFDESLAHLLEAGADAFLMPSRFEPCGMNQMYSQRYGTPPIANATGGLVDTITDEAMGIGNAKATGFLMREASTTALVETVERAVAAFRAPRQWRNLQLNGMARDFGWAHAAREYVAIYERINRGLTTVS
jgi:starch synthase